MTIWLLLGKKRSIEGEWCFCDVAIIGQVGRNYLFAYFTLN